MSALLAAGLFAAVAAPAQAEDSIDYFGDGLDYIDDSGENSTLTIAASRTQIVIAQEGGDTIDTGAVPECTGDGTATVTCTPSDPQFTGYSAFMDDGNDIVTANGELGGGIFGDVGDDLIAGSDTNGSGEGLFGGDGTDQINSRNVGAALPIVPVTRGFGDPSLVGDFVTGGNGSDNLATGNGFDDVSGDGEVTFIASFNASKAPAGTDGFSEGTTPGTDVVSTGSGNDFGEGGSGNGDQVNLGEGDDFGDFDEGDGTGDSLDGGNGIDELDFDEDDETGDEVAPNVTFDMATGAVTAGADSATAMNFEDTFTGDGVDNLRGNAASNVIDAFLGSDNVNPGDGADTVFLDPQGFAIMASRGTDGFTPPNFGADTADLADGFGDRVFCGAGLDTINADQFDQVAADCESVTRVERRAGGADVIAPDCKVSRVKRSYGRNAFFRGFRVRVACSEAATLVIQVIARFNKGLFARAGDVVLAQKTVNLTGANATTRVKPLKKFKQRLRKKGFRARVNVEARDQYGNRSVERKAVKVKKAPSKKRK